MVTRRTTWVCPWVDPIHPAIHPAVDDCAGRFPDTGGMTTTDYIIDIALIGLVLQQVRGGRINARSLLVTLGIVAYLGFTNLKGTPTGGIDLLLVFGLGAVGVILGALAGRFTSVTRDPAGRTIAKAGVVAAALWILGMGSRLAFQLFAAHGGAAAIERFNAGHDITSIGAWTSAVILLTLCEAVTRTGVVARRTYAQRRALGVEVPGRNLVTATVPVHDGRL